MQLGDQRVKIFQFKNCLKADLFEIIAQNIANFLPYVVLAVANESKSDVVAFGILANPIVVAVNKAKEAPIFNIANYSIIGDATELVPALTKKFKAELKGE